MKPSFPRVICGVAAVVASHALAFAQPAPAPSPMATPATAPAPSARPRAAPETPAPEGRRAGDRTFTFQLVLLVADSQGGSRFENVPANAQKALDDVKGFLPYTNYRLLDLAWIRSSRNAEAQIAGPDGRSLSASLRFFSDAADPDRIDVQRLVIVEAPKPPLLLEAPRSDGAPTALAPQPLRPLLETSFGMRAGETVVVGTAKLDGPSKALVVLLSALP